MIWKKDIQRLRQEQRSEDGVTYTRVWVVPADASPADLGLTLGGALPSETGIANAEIIEVKGAVEEKTPGTMTITVRALAPLLWVGVSFTDTVRELAHSRTMKKSADLVTLVRRFEVNDSDLAESAGGWSADGLATMGESYPTGVWSIRPKVSAIDWDGTYSPSKTLVTVTYTGYLAWGEGGSA